MSLALWIGAYVLFLFVRPLSPRALATSQRSIRTALGGWLAPTLVGLVQVASLVLVVGRGVDIRIAHPVLAFLFLCFTSMTFVAILHALAARLGAVGKFLGLVFMVVQLVSAGGTFPWQTLPAPLQAVHHVVPMSHAVDGLRRLALRRRSRTGDRLGRRPRRVPARRARSVDGRGAPVEDVDAEADQARPSSSDPG